MKKIKKPHFVKIKNVLHKIGRRRLIIIAVICFILISTIGVISYFILTREPAETVKPPIAKVVDVPVPEPIKYYSPLSGTLVADESATKLPVTGVMIENSPDARPQSGLKNSDIVFEAIAEGGITRFLVLYQQQKPQLIGPVRSVRLYYVEWLAAFNASIAHVGGSDEALAEVRNGNYRDLDQFFNSDTYWRSTDRYAPHNVYTSFDNLDALNKEKGYTYSTFNGFSRIDGKSVELTDATEINISISSDLFNSSYTYDKTSNTYARYQAGAPHTDRELGQITPSVVVAMKVNESSTSDYGHHERIDTISSGDAVIFQNGTAINATWKKTSATEQISFSDVNGKDIPLVRGQTWIVAVPIVGGDISWQ